MSDTDTIRDALTVAHSGFKLGAEAGRHPNSGDTIYTRALAALARLVAERAALEAERNSNCKIHGWYDPDQRGPGYCPYCVKNVRAEATVRLQAEALSALLPYAELWVRDQHGATWDQHPALEAARAALAVSEARPSAIVVPDWARRHDQHCPANQGGECSREAGCPAVAPREEQTT